MCEPAPRVTAVVVSFNRRALVLDALDAVCKQTRRPDTVLVVDNASTDGTADAVRREYPDVEIIALARNLGGAGGFALGIATALAAGAGLLWLLDDDSWPRVTALETLLAARDRHPRPVPALVASRVIWVDGRDHPMNTPRRRPLAGGRARAAAEQAGCVPIRTASFVSVLVDGAAVRRAGLPEVDFFLWNDDFEFTARLLRDDVGLLCPASVVMHRTRAFGAGDVDPGDRFFYEVRNKIWTMRSGDALHTWERAVYTTATLRRWARTYRRSPGRTVLRAAFAAGVRAGVRTRPRPTEAILAEIGTLSHA